MYCSSSQLLLIRLVGPPDVVAVVAVVAEAVENSPLGWFLGSPHYHLTLQSLVLV